ncbi:MULTISPECIES: G5 domain-containing protein [unclassified Streptococcus]|uniref:G5 domain-containing protein n=1 Tax=unclassified Streptococcus TaxID=2608887 RepID=UPI00211B0582|nr:G5 domain-containing protein [Streptococcus sp. B01]MCQ9213501.1 G5 domain-containing protein [Streptococcus sp. O1]
MKKSSFDWNRVGKYAIRKFSVGIASVMVGSILLPSIVPISYVYAETQPVTARDIFDLESRVKSNLNFFTTPSPSYESIETSITTIRREEVASANRHPNDYTNESYAAYVAALAQATTLANSLESAVSKGRAIQGLAPGYFSEISGLIDAKRADMAYNTVSQEEKVSIYSRLQEILVEVNYQTEFGNTANPLAIEATVNALDKAVKGLSLTIAKELEPDFQNPIPENLRVSVDHFENVTASDLAKIDQLLDDRYYIGEYAHTLSYEGRNLIITYTDDGSQTIVPIEAVAIARNIAPQPSQPVVETKEEIRTEPVAYKTVRRANASLAEGQEQVIQQGQNGVRTIVETVTLTDGRETSRVEKSSSITTEPVDEIIEYGTQKVPVVETREEIRTEPVAYRTVRRANASLAEGFEQVVQQGQNGVRTIVETVTLTDGRETSRVEKSSSITTEPVDEIIEYGTQKAPVVETREEIRTEPVAYRTVRRANASLAEGFEQVVQQGQNGVRTIVETVTLTDGRETSRVEKSNSITTEPVDEIIEYGTQKVPVVETKEESRTEPVAYKTVRRANASLAEGQEQVIQQGQNGVRTIVETVTLTDGRETSRVEKSNSITTEPVDEIIEYGTQKVPVVETKEESRTEPVSYRTVRRANASLAEGQEQVIQQGQNGVRTIVETVTLTDGRETSRVEKSNSITTEPVDEIIEYGTQKAPVVETREESRTEPVAYKTVRRANASLAAGFEQVVQQGQNGVRTIVETVTLTDGRETSRVEKSNSITTEPVDEIIEYGTQKAPVVETKEESRTELVAYKTVRRANASLAEGQEQVIQQGQNGVRTIVETVTLTDGRETSRVEKSSSITTEPVDEIIEYGTQKVPVVETREESRTEPVAYKTVRRANASLAEGFEQVVQQGQNGVRTIVETVTLIDGRETSRVEKSNSITTEPVDEIIEYGTQKAPVVETKEESRTELVAYRTVRRANASLAEGQEQVIQQGQNGVRTIVETVTLTDGRETSRVEKSNSITTEPVDEIIEYGTQKAPVVETKEESRTEPVAYKTVRRANASLAEGFEQVVQQGQNGVRTIVETVTLTDGRETSRVEKSNSITTEPVDEIIEYGTQKAPVVETREEIRTEPVAYRTVRRANASLAEGFEQVVQQGQNGVRTIVETVTLTDGRETSRVEKSNSITTDPVDEIIEYGTQKAPVVEMKEKTALASNKKSNFLSVDDKEDKETTLTSKDIDIKEQKHQSVLPKTGEIEQLFLPLATFIIVTASAVIDLKPRKK